MAMDETRPRQQRGERLVAGHGAADALRVDAADRAALGRDLKARLASEHDQRFGERLRRDVEGLHGSLRGFLSGRLREGGEGRAA